MLRAYPMTITKDTPIEEVLNIPAAEEVLMMHGLGCAGCSGCGSVNFGTLANVAKMHGLKADQIVAEINRAIDAAEED